MIYIESKKKALKTLATQYPGARIVDVTSKGDDPWLKLSPFYPHGQIPIPYSPGQFAFCVEGIWQGLKVFEKEGVDRTKFAVKDMKNIKRTVTKFGKPLGHRKGVFGTELLDYITARKEIFLPSYIWMLENKTKTLVQALKAMASQGDLVLLDFETNEDIEDPRKPLSHAALIKGYLEGKYSK